MPEPEAATDYRNALRAFGRGNWWAVGMRAITWALLGPVHGRLLDVGCGPGWSLAELPPGVWGLGIDRQRQDFVARPIVLADAARLPCAAGIFDVLLATDLLEQGAVDPRTALSEARRVLRPGGRLLLRVPAYPWLLRERDRYWGGVRRYRRDELAHLVQAAGFRIRRLTYADSLLLPVLAPLRLLERGPLVRAELRPLPRPANALLAAALRLEARWLRSHDLAAGLSLVCLAES